MFEVRKSINELVVNGKVCESLLITTDTFGIGISPCYGCDESRSVELKRIDRIKDTILLRLVVDSVEIEIPLVFNGISGRVSGLHFCCRDLYVDSGDYECVIDINETDIGYFEYCAKCAEEECE